MIILKHLNSAKEEKKNSSEIRNELTKIIMTSMRKSSQSLVTSNPRILLIRVRVSNQEARYSCSRVSVCKKQWRRLLKICIESERSRGWRVSHPHTFTSFIYDHTVNAYS